MLISIFLSSFSMFSYVGGQSGPSECNAALQFAVTTLQVCIYL